LHRGHTRRGENRLKLGENLQREERKKSDQRWSVPGGGGTELKSRSNRSSREHEKEGTKGNVIKKSGFFPARGSKKEKGKQNEGCPERRTMGKKKQQERDLSARAQERRKRGSGRCTIIKDNWGENRCPRSMGIMFQKRR